MVIENPEGVIPSTSSQPYEDFLSQEMDADGSGEASEPVNIETP